MKCHDELEHTIEFARVQARVISNREADPNVKKALDDLANELRDWGRFLRRATWS